MIHATQPILAEFARAETDALVIGLRAAQGTREVRIAWADTSARLASASREQREDLELSPGGYGISWPRLDEDLAIGPLVQGGK